MIDFENLRGQWEKTSRVEHGYTQVDTRPLDCHVGYDEKFRRTLLIIGNVKTKIPPSSLSVEIKQWQRKDRKFSLALSLLSEDEAAVFFEMCRDLLEFAEEATDESQALKKFWQRYDHWQKLFVAAKKDLLTPEQQRGLIGELLFLQKQILDGRPLAESVDGWLQDEADNSIVMFVVSYVNDDGEPMTKTLAEKNFRLLETFVEEVLSKSLDIEESTSTAELAEILRANDDARIKFILLTNARRSVKLNEIKSFSVNGNEVECQLWDIERIFNVYNSMQVREPVTINFGDLCGGLPCLRAANAGDACESFLCVIPGKILADIYDRHGSRLLESNVRSFLSSKGAVNKKIRATILNQPEKFFAFNNGIAVTAKSIELKNSAYGLYLTSATDFQIINGGQTTASLLNARLKDKDKAKLEKIFVQMKLTRIGDMATDEQEKLIGEISKSSNSQNKVSDADFFATHPFHKTMEEISRRIFAPSQGNVQRQTRWFYERARGQYVQEQLKMTAAQRKKFQLENPKSHVMTKTDLAKFRMSWQENPDIVSKGAQANFKKFADEISTAWEKNSVQFNEYYFKETVALAIMFRAVEKIVDEQDWYKKAKSFRANIVTYSLAIFHHALKKKFPAAELDLREVWNLQALPDEWKEIFAAITFSVNNFITDKSRGIQNVTQWCKQAPCWDRMKNSLRVELPENFSRWMVDPKELRVEKKEAIEIQKTSNEVDAQTKVSSYSGATWQRIRDDAARNNFFLTLDERLALSTATKIPTRTPAPFQCEKLLRLLNRLEENGLTYESDLDPYLEA